MKKLIQLIFLTISLQARGAVPTEEGLLRNLNNANIPGNLISIKAMVTLSDSENSKADYYKFLISLENPNAISLLQIAYSNGQMLNSQIKDVKYVPDITTFIKREKSLEKSLFYAVLEMLTTNKSSGVEAFLDKNGVQVVKNKNVLNEDKMKLLRAYRTYLANNKGKGEANSPLNPADPKEKSKVIELFRANTFERAKNIELTKVDNEFAWKVDWKTTQGYFTNEERRLRRIDFSSSDLNARLDATEYIMFNGTNELPKYIFLKDTKGIIAKIQILGLDTKTNREKKLNERYEEAKKLVPPTVFEGYSFLY